jgi:hypothetical protein
VQRQGGDSVITLPDSGAYRIDFDMRGKIPGR